MTKIMHFSDNHSAFLPLKGEFDIIVSSGDFLPNRTRGNLSIEPVFQKSWVIDNLDNLTDWLGKDKPFLFCEGNHDFYNPVSLLRSAGIQAYDITNKSVNINGFNFYGFPYIPYIGGEWNYELRLQDMADEVRKLVRRINDGLVDVLVAHCPIYGILDRCWDNRKLGNTVMKNAFEYMLHVWPKAYLCGHIHDDHGIQELESPFKQGEYMIISNAATTTRIIEL